MPSIGSMAVAITANTSQFSKGLDKVQSQAAGFGKAIAGIGAALGGALAIKSLVDFASQQAEAIDQVAKLSDTLGIATEDLLTFQHAADLSGATSEDLATGLKKMAKFAEESSNPLSEQAKTLALLGVSAAEFSSLDVGEQFLKIADAISQLPAGGVQVKAAMDIFGKGGAALVPTLAQGADAIRKIGQDLGKRGLLFSREEASRVERANDALTEMKRTFTGIVQQAVIELSPIVENIVEAFRKWVDQAGGLKGAFQEVAKVTATWLADLIEGLGSVIAQITALKNGGKFPEIGVRFFGGEKHVLIPGATGNTADENPFAEQVRRLRGVGSGATSHGNGWSWGIDIQKAMKDQLKADIEEAVKALQEWDRALGKSIDIISQSASPLQKFQQTVGILGDFANEFPLFANLTDKAFADAFKQLESALPKDHGPSDAVERGSAQALATIARLEQQRAQGNMDPQERVRRVLEQTKIIEQQQLLEAARLRRAFEQGNNNNIVNF